MTVTLTPELEELIALKVASGEFATPEDVVATGLGLLNNLNPEERVKLKWLREQVAIGVADIERGACSVLDMEEVKREARRRFEANRNSNGTH
ncbi:MAG TPA: hypothetical protein VGK19_04970 [Capsulimonadaceae bacterium]|jgi:antitoxin ParD1/3/4